MKTSELYLCIFAVVAASSCTLSEPVPSGLPDLVVLIPEGHFSTKDGYCKLDATGQLLVTVANKGTAPSSKAGGAVDFTGSGFKGASFIQPFATYALYVPPIAPGSSVDVTSEIPEECFAPDCLFRLNLNPRVFGLMWDNEYYQDELDVTNNETFGRCRKDRATTK